MDSLFFFFIIETFLFWVVLLLELALLLAFCHFKMDHTFSVN